MMKLELTLKKSWKDKITQLELKPELFPNDVSLKGYKILVIESQNEESDMMGVKSVPASVAMNSLYSVMTTAKRRQNSIPKTSYST